MCRVGQNRVYTPYMTVYLMISLPKVPYTHRIYMVLANPIYVGSDLSPPAYCVLNSSARHPPQFLLLICAASKSL
jgi:hypothetical protein